MVSTSYPKHDGDATAPFIAAMAEGVARRGRCVDVVLPGHPRLVSGVRNGVHLHRYRYAPLPGLRQWGYAKSMAGDVRLRRAAYAAAPFALAATLAKTVAVAARQHSAARPRPLGHPQWPAGGAGGGNARPAAGRQPARLGCASGRTQRRYWRRCALGLSPRRRGDSVQPGPGRAGGRARRQSSAAVGRAVRRRCGALSAGPGGAGGDPSATGTSGRCPPSCLGSAAWSTKRASTMRSRRLDRLG